MMISHYPQLRMRRLRQKDWIRRFVAENSLSPSDFIWPIFIIEGNDIIEPITSMHDIHRLTIDHAIKRAQQAVDLGIPCLALFPNIPPDKRHHDGREAYNPDNLICRAIKEIKNVVPEIGIMCDVALDPYTTHGHDGLLENGHIMNDKTIDILIKQSLIQVDAGCDIIAPSDMMDGRIGKIRSALEDQGYVDTIIISYAIKYASGFYGPFRDAIGSNKHLQGDKKSYQMNPSNSDEALREVALDLSEGADIILIKPGMPYLDIIHKVKTAFHIPVLGYQVSGEYAMLQASIEQKLFCESIIIESLLSFKRAGADGIISYFAPVACRQLLQL